MLNNLVRYFDLLSNVRPKGPEAVGVGVSLPAWFPQWIALLLGIIVQPSFATYQSTHTWQFHGFAGWLLASVIIAVAIFPAVYKGALDPTKPWLVQIAPIFTAGLGWNTLFSAAATAVADSAAKPG